MRQGKHIVEDTVLMEFFEKYSNEFAIIMTENSQILCYSYKMITFFVLHPYSSVDVCLFRPQD